MELQSEPEHRAEKSCELWACLTSFYHNHFPTDEQSFNQRIPFLGFVCTLSGVFCLLPLVGFAFPILLVFLLLSIGFAYQLFCGLKNGDRKQFTPWIILKFLELPTVIVINIIFFIYVGPDLAYDVVFLILFIVSTVCNIWIFYIVVAKSCRMRNFRMGMMTTTSMAQNNEEKENKCQFGRGSVIIECSSAEVVSTDQ